MHHDTQKVRFSCSLVLYLQVIKDPDDFSGEFDAVALVIGTNNIGNYAVHEVVETIYETVEILKSLNPGAYVFASEVSSTNTNSLRTTSRNKDLFYKIRIANSIPISN